MNRAVPRPHVIPGQPDVRAVSVIPAPAGIQFTSVIPAEAGIQALPERLAPRLRGGDEPWRAALRNALLPKLVSGELRIRDVARIIGLPAGQAGRCA